MGFEHFGARAFLSIAIVIFLMAAPAFAQEQDHQPPQVITSSDSDQVKIVIDGRTVAVFTKDGLYVVGDVTYGGKLIDAGEQRIHNLVGDDKRPPAEGGAGEK